MAASTSSYLAAKSLAWASGSLVAAGRVRPTLRPNTQLDILHIFAPGLPKPASGFSTIALTKHYHQRRKVEQTNQLLRRGFVRYQSTQTQQNTNSSSSDSNSYPITTTLSKDAKPSPSAYHAQSAGVPPKAPLSLDPLPASSNTAAELGSPANQTSASQTMLAEHKAKEIQLDAKKPKPPLSTRVWAKVKEEALHYWHGSKLLAKEVRISWRLLRRLMLGYSLTRREKRQLKRTFADLLRLIPFIPFIIIPAGELLLPVAIKIFPNMLPSTFESKFSVQEKRRGLIKVRLEMAKFLQETIKEGGLQATHKVKTSEEFKEFFRKVRSTGESPSNEDIIKVAQLFEDDLTLDNLTRPQLVSVCRYMQINAFGTDNYLRYQIRHKLNRIRQDDIVISHEGADNMSQAELVSACQNRGIQTANLSEERLRQELQQWIDLHVRNKISGTLLVLSKAFNYVAAGSNDDNAQSHLRSLELTLSSLPDNLVNEAELSVNSEGATNKQRLEVLQQQEELIEDEAEQEQEEAAAREADKERRNAEKARLTREEEEARLLLPKKETDPHVEDARMTNEQLTELGEALSILSAKSSVLKEREELAQLIKEVSSTETASGDSASSASATASDEASTASSSGEAASAASAAAEKGESTSSTSASASSRSITKRIKSMLEKIDNQLEEYDRDVGSRMHLIEASHTGKISVDDLEQALRLIKHKPEDEVIEKIVDKLDVDHDGLVPLDDVLELARAETGLGILRDEGVRQIHQQGKEIRNGDSGLKPKKSDIVED
ncbi:related to leucine zipper-EF-hand containing transmembrane protein 1 [Melanopsichium pennsylvanicum]|uniref:Mitochondrial proton/calcium exchanger protein n=2 Tax=Melanopsichium pennsylvanicum TaxID=63383 RepID=A0AAJ5C6W5_9BASI|nr:related to leucine zipper-EF-hand containing transmembrane protein 1 [Melanopsichium pennsylvanicum 4]SNX86296.1 related to leucine zipper-EF-hand containing transmembrane protein 1 [Melanopsichium pennsylvanicum]